MDGGSFGGYLINIINKNYYTYYELIGTWHF